MAYGTFHDIDSILDLLPANIQGARILDIGFGCGQISHTIVSFANRNQKISGEPYIVGIDVDPINVDFAKKWMPFIREVYLYDAINIPYPENIIKDLDIIICTEVIEHIEDKEKVLKMIEYLRDKAKLVIFVCPYGNTLSRVGDDVIDYHKSIWYDTDFKKLGFNTKIINRIYWSGLEYMIVSSVMTIINFFKPHNKSILRTIIAWKVNKLRC